MKEIYRSYTVSEATSVLEKFCSYQERCHQEVKRKLKEMRMIPEAIDQIIVYLIDSDYLNEERFAMQFTRGKFNIKKWGRIRLKNELSQRKISKYNIDKALSQIDDKSYQNVFDELAESRWKYLERVKDINTRKRKLKDYLEYRGWEYGLIYEKISELQQNKVKNP